MTARVLGGAGVGIGLRAGHYREILERRPALGFVEVHSENYFGETAGASLERARRDYPVSLHGVGLSLGSADPLDERHLDKLAALAGRIDPAFVSDHLSWSSIDARHANELLPMPFTPEAAAHVATRISRVQERLGRRILVENVSSYCAFAASDMAEWEFVSEVARRSGCALLLDVNNIWVNAKNFGFDPRRYLAGIEAAAVAQYHLGGFEAREAMLVDTHGARVAGEVWELFRDAVARIGARPTLVEWDTELPALDVLLEEARLARAIVEREADRVAA
ncbi:MAG: DUF692 domain-containing protein [Burkholderiales bacterium]|nr:DUF692 domain-containing protein [Burkholderiales bacterium]